MGWVNGLPISVGELAGSFIGFSDMGTGTDDFNITRGEFGRFDSQQLNWLNTEFDKQIDVSEYFTPDHADFDIELAGVNIVDENKNVTARFVCRLSKSGNQWHLNNRLENPSGAVIAYIMRSQSGNVTISYDISGSYATGIHKQYLALSISSDQYGRDIAWVINSSECGSKWGNYYWGQWSLNGSGFSENALWDTFGIAGSLPEGKKKSPEFGPASTPSGGYNTTPDTQHGTFDDSSDEIALDAKPTYGVTSVGFINVYKIEQNELISLGEKLFPHFLPAEILADPSQLSVQEVLVWFIKMAYGTLIAPTGTSIDFNDNLGIFDILMNGKLIDYVLDCHVIPTSISGATVSPLKIGYRTFNDFQLAKATEDYVDIDCGELYIKEFYGNFLDYSGNLKVELYLPMVGFVPIDNEFWNNATIKVIYRFNIIDGSFQAKIFTTREDDKSKIHNSLVAQYGGVCCVHFPITGLQYSNVISGLVNGGTSAVLQGSSGNVAGAVSSAFNMAMLKPDNPSSNGYNASSSFLSHRTPYLVIKMPVAQFSENYPKEIGLPLNVTYPLSQIHGFTIIENPVLNIRCSDEEYNELVSLLRSGVIF